MSAYLSLYHDCWKMKKKENGMIKIQTVIAGYGRFRMQ